MPYPHMAMMVATFLIVVGFEAFEYDVYVVFFGEDVGEVFNQFQYVAGDVGRAFGVDGYFRTRADVFRVFLMAALFRNETSSASSKLISSASASSSRLR